MIYKAKDFNNRLALETQVIADFGRTVDKKAAKITGKVVELEKLGLAHAQIIWGVQVEASDYEPANATPVKRGKKVAGKLNGVTR